MTDSQNDLNICVLGQGIIGSIWGQHYHADGHRVRAWNRTPQPHNRFFEADINAAVRDADILHICLAGPPSVEPVLRQALAAAPQGCMVIQSSTISPGAASRFASMAKEAGALYLEAPFTGSKPAAEARQLVFFLGGEAAAISRAESVLLPLSRKRFHFDSPAKAAAIKLSMNLQIAAISQAMTEGFHLAQQYGISGEDFFAVLNENVARSGLVDLKQQKLLNRDYHPQFSIKHMCKDLLLALEAADNRPLHLNLTASCAAIYQQGLQQQLGDLDFIALEQLVREA